MITVAVPTYEMVDGDKLLTRLLESLWNQSFQEFEIVITDNSDNDVIKSICEYYKSGISYYRNPRKGMAQNTNEAIKKSKGELIKILYMDDFMAHDEALEKIVTHFEGEWLVTGCNHLQTDVLGIIRGPFHNHTPYYSENIHTGNNTIGSPSVLTIRNEHPILFDEEMMWMLDCDYYKRLYTQYGEPTILKDINITIGLHSGQATNIMGDERKQQEHIYLSKKYA